MKVFVAVRAIIIGLIIALIPANVWTLVLGTLGVPVGGIAEILFLALYLCWVSGNGPPRSNGDARLRFFRRTVLSSGQWVWGLLVAFVFAATIHTAIVFLFRLVPFPSESFRHDYDISFIPSFPLRWIAIVISAVSAAICEETGFRGFMQQPIEQRFGIIAGVLISSFFFTLVHLTKSWALLGMTPIVFGAGVLLGVIAWASGSLIPGMIGHFVMDVGLFAFWWTGIAGTFTAKPIFQTGVDGSFVVTCVALVIMLSILIMAIGRLRRVSTNCHLTNR